MNIKKLNEELEKFIVNEISDNLKQSYLAGRQAQADKALAKLNKAKQVIKKSDERQLKNLSKETDEQNAKNALEDVKYEMRKISNGQDWRTETEDNIMSLQVRYWGSWSGDDGSGDYDWQTLDQEYRDKLDKLVANIAKKYNVKIEYSTGEKNWISVDIKIKEDKQEDKDLLQQILDLGFEDATGPQQKKAGTIMLQGKYTSRGYRIIRTSSVDYIASVLNNYGVHSKGFYRIGKELCHEWCLDNCLKFIIEDAQKHLKRMKVI